MDGDPATSIPLDRQIFVPLGAPTLASARGVLRKQLARIIGRLGQGDVMVLTRLDRPERSTGDLLAIAGKGAGFRSPRDTNSGRQ